MAEPSSPRQLSSASSKDRRTNKAVFVDEALNKTSNEPDASGENSEGENSLTADENNYMLKAIFFLGGRTKLNAPTTKLPASDNVIGLKDDTISDESDENDTFLEDEESDHFDLYDEDLSGIEDTIYDEESQHESSKASSKSSRRSKTTNRRSSLGRRRPRIRRKSNILQQRNSSISEVGLKDHLASKIRRYWMKLRHKFRCCCYRSKLMSIFLLILVIVLVTTGVLVTKLRKKENIYDTAMPSTVPSVSMAPSSAPTRNGRLHTLANTFRYVHTKISRSISTLSEIITIYIYYVNIHQTTTFLAHSCSIFPY